MAVRISPQAAVATVFVAAMFITIIDATVVNVALPTIAADLGVPVELTATVNIGFLVAVAVAIPVAGWLGDRLGAREVFLAAVTLFTLASAACGLAATVQQLVIFRIVQGLGGGLMTPVGMAMLYRTFPPSERVRLSRIINIPIALAPAIGPVLGSFLVQRASWRWIFWINLPIGILAVIFTVLAVPRMARRTNSRLDVPGFLLAAIGFASLMFALSEGAVRGWTTPSIWIPGLLGVTLLALLVVVEGRVSAPMLRLQLFGLRLFRSANLITFASAAGFLGGLFVYPLMLQTAFGYPPLTAGLLTFPEAIGIMVGTQIASRLYRRVGRAGWSRRDSSPSHRAGRPVFRDEQQHCAGGARGADVRAGHRPGAHVHADPGLGIRHGGTRAHRCGHRAVQRDQAGGVRRRGGRGRDHHRHGRRRRDRANRAAGLPVGADRLRVVLGGWQPDRRAHRARRGCRAQHGAGPGHPRGGVGVVNGRSGTWHQRGDGRGRRHGTCYRAGRLAPAVRVSPPARGIGHST